MTGPRSRRHRTVPVLACVAAIALTACSRSVAPATPDVVAALPGQFVGGLAVSVTTGSTGLEGSPTNVAASWWWFNEPVAAITVTNNDPVVARPTVSAILVAPKCLARATVQITVGTQPPTKVGATKAGTRLSLPVTVVARGQLVVHVAVLTPSCRVAGDSRTLYAQLVGLTVKP